jgi:hypothetical protein
MLEKDVFLKDGQREDVDGKERSAVLVRVMNSKDDERSWNEESEGDESDKSDVVDAVNDIFRILK